MQSEIVVINAAIIASGQGIGFAIPINLAKGIIEQIETSGEVSRDWMGVAIQLLTGELADYYGLKDGKAMISCQYVIFSCYQDVEICVLYL